jgi:CheY-like chemotaxis protein
MVTNAKILQVDDDENNVFFLRRALDKAGLAHSLFHVHDGQEAVEYLTGKDPYNDRSKFPLPDLLLLDLKMPRMNGFDVLAWLRSQPELNKFPVVVFSSSNREEDVQQALSLGASDFQTKPLDPQSFVQILQALDQRWLSSPSSQ